MENSSLNNEFSAGGLIAFHPGALGDAIIACLTLRAAAGGGRRLVLAGRDYWRPLAESWPFVARFVSLDSGPLAQLYQQPPQWPETIPAPPQAFEKALVFAKNDANPLTLALKRLGLPAVVTLPSRPWGTGRRLAQEQFQAAGLARQAPPGFFKPLDPPALWLAEARRLREQTGPADRPLLIIQPGSGAKLKNWPLDNFISLARRALGQGWEPVFLLGPNEIGLAANLVAWPVWADLPLTAAAGLLAGAAYLGNDSGLSHLAGLYGAWGAAVFGPTDPAVWGPAGQIEAVAAPPGQAWPQMEEVWARLWAKLESFPGLTI